VTKLLHEVVTEALSGDPDEVALEFKGEDVNWRYLRSVADAVNAVLDRAGLGESAQIGFVPRNRPAFAAALLALLAKRRSVIMVYAFQSPKAIATDIAKLNLPAVIADAQDWTPETLGALAPGALGISLESVMGGDEPVRVVAGDPENPATGARGPSDVPLVELLTSGTTGIPKRSPTSYATIEAAVINGSVLDGGGKTGQKKGDPGTVNFPISNISGIYSFLPMVALRRLVLFQEKFDLDLWLSFVQKHRPRIVVIPPAGIRMLLDRDLPRDTFAGVAYIQVGTSALDVDAHRAFEERFGVSILLSYGATEFCGVATTMTDGMHQQYGAAKFGSVGKPPPGNEIRIIDQASGAILPANEVGVIEVKVSFLGDDFIKTTDLGVIDEDGFLYHRGRIDGVIMRGGFKIMPRAVESVIDNFTGVAASSVVGVPDRRLGEVPVAVVEMRDGVPAPDPATLETHIRGVLPATNIPVAYHFVDALPRTPSLKIDLKAVKAFAAGLAAQERVG
jgi:long-chain acyl-CoA synthetase